MQVEIGAYKGDTGWDGWVCTESWIAFHGKGRTLIYKRGKNGAVVGEPLAV